MEQLLCLIAFTVTGIVIGVLFDVFRILRRSFKTADWLTTLQDILFWILAGFITLFSIFKFNNGEIRSYIFIGIALGVLIYMLTLSKYIVKYSVIIIKFIKKIISYIIIKFIKKIISYPVNLIFKIFNFLLIKPIKFLAQKLSIFFKKIFQNTTKIMKKKEKNKIKLQEKEGIL